MIPNPNAPIPDPVADLSPDDQTIIDRHAAALIAAWPSHRNDGAPIYLISRIDLAEAIAANPPPELVGRLDDRAIRRAASRAAYHYPGRSILP